MYVGQFSALTAAKCNLEHPVAHCKFNPGHRVDHNMEHA